MHSISIHTIQRKCLLAPSCEKLACSIVNGVPQYQMERPCLNRLYHPPPGGRWWRSPWRRWAAWRCGRRRRWARWRRRPAACRAAPAARPRRGASGPAGGHPAPGKPSLKLAHGTRHTCWLTAHTWLGVVDIYLSWDCVYLWTFGCSTVSPRQKIEHLLIPDLDDTLFTQCRRYLNKKNVVIFQITGKIMLWVWGCQQIQDFCFHCICIKILIISRSPSPKWTVAQLSVSDVLLPKAILQDTLKWLYIMKMKFIFRVL